MGTEYCVELHIKELSLECIDELVKQYDALRELAEEKGSTYQQNYYPDGIDTEAILDFYFDNKKSANDLYKDITQNKLGPHNIGGIVEICLLSRDKGKFILPDNKKVIIPAKLI